MTEEVKKTKQLAQDLADSLVDQIDPKHKFIVIVDDNMFVLKTLEQISETYYDFRNWCFSSLSAATSWIKAKDNRIAGVVLDLVFPTGDINDEMIPLLMSHKIPFVVCSGAANAPDLISPEYRNQIKIFSKGKLEAITEMFDYLKKKMDEQKG